MLFLIPLVILLILVPACSSDSGKGPGSTEDGIQRPNFVLILTEDISPLLSCYGDSTICTPNLERLAAEGVVYTRVYSTSGVCAPSRSAIITGMYPASVGSNHMRTRFDKDELNLPVDEYAVVMPEKVRCFTELFRQEGYYCTNRGKRDWQFGKPLSAFNDYGKEGAHWRNRKPGQSFFSIFNIFVTHESQVWQKAEDSLACLPEAVPVPPYYPDTKIVRRDIARVYSNILEMDQMVGDIINELEKKDLLDSTCIIFLSDHGGPLPRQKREILSAGLRVPMIIRFPGKARAGEVDSSLISFVDLAPSFLDFANIEIPDYLQGISFLGKGKDEKRKYVFGARDRMDSQYDRCRSVSDGKFLYVRNYFPDRSWIQEIEYRKQMRMMQELNEMHSENLLDTTQEQWFCQSKPVEMLFDLRKDPHEIRNLASQQAYGNKLKEFRSALENWTQSYGDKGTLSEYDLILSMWPGFIQPKTEAPLIRRRGKAIEISCDTPGSSIVYCFLPPGREPDPHEPNEWKLYKEALEIRNDRVLYAIANRIGYKNSEIIKKDFNTRN